MTSIPLKVYGTPKSLLNADDHKSENTGNVHISPAKEEKSRRDRFESPVGFPRCPVYSIHHYRKQSVTTSSSASPAVLAVKYVLD